MQSKEIQKMPIPGMTYKHYKGEVYRVLHLAKHTETDELLVIYQSLHFGSYHARPLESWNTPVNSNPRFWQYIIE